MERGWDTHSSHFIARYVRTFAQVLYSAFSKEPGSCACPLGWGLKADRSGNSLQLVWGWAAGETPSYPKACLQIVQE